MYHKVTVLLLALLIGLLGIVHSWGSSTIAQQVVEDVPCAAEPTDMTIQFSDVIKCAIEVAGDTDIFRFASSGNGEVLRIQITSPDNVMSPCMELIAPDNSREEGCSVFNVDQIDTRLNQAGTYTILVRSFWGDRKGAYNLALERLMPPSPDAQQLHYGQNLTAGQIDPAGDMDIFYFEGKSEDVIAIQVTSPDNMMSPCMELIAPDNTREEGCSVFNVDRIDTTLNQSGTYALLVRSFWGDRKGAFNLALQCLNRANGPCPTPSTVPTTDTPTPTVTPSPTVLPTITPSSNDDLLGYVYELWTDPVTLRARQNAELALIVHRQGGKQPLANVKVSFYLGNPQANATLLGNGTISLVAPRQSATTSTVSWTPENPGEYTIYAMIDPENTISESDETNNMISRTVTILTSEGVGDDRLAPHVDNFTINKGATSTDNHNVTLDTVVSDPIPSSGIYSLYLVEHEYNINTNHWKPVNESGWIDYETNRTAFQWQLAPTLGLKYIQAWASDRSGNISVLPFKARINYIPANNAVAQNGIQLYRYELQAGDRLAATLTAIQGDPDLYIWAPDHETRPPWVSNLSEQSDQVTFVAPTAGIYQIEIYGYSAAEYQLTVDVTPSAQTRVMLNTAQLIHQGKPLRENPLIPLASGPGIFMPTNNTNSLPITKPNPIYLPIIQR